MPAANYTKYAKNLLQSLFYLSAILIIWRLISYSTNWINEGDTGALIRYSDHLLACLKEDAWPGCRNAGPFPILQYFPAILLRILGQEERLIFDTLGLASTVGFIGSFGLFVYYFSTTHRRDMAMLGLVCLLSSPLLIYGRSTFGEMTAAFLTLLFMVLILKKAPWWAVAITAMLVCLTKDIAVLFLPLLGAGAVYTYFQEDRKQAVRSGLGILAGCGSGFSIVMFINYFRSGKLYNALYTLDYYMVPDGKNMISFFLGQWFAPNAGMFFFWTSFCFLAGVILLARFRLKRLFTAASLPLLLSLMVLGGMTLGLARWWAPFGWIAWGPRLMLPWIPATLLLFLHCYHSEIKAMFRWLQRYKKTGILLLCTLALSGLAQFYAVDDPHKYSNRVVEPDPPHCPKMAIIEESQDYYYKCMAYRMWKPKLFILPEVLSENFLSERFVWGVLYLIFWTGLLFRARELCLREPESMR